MFIFLVVVFAGGFVFFGVGSGSTGIGDLLRGNLGIFGNSKSSANTPSINAALKKLAKEHRGDFETGAQNFYANDEYSINSFRLRVTMSSAA